MWFFYLVSSDRSEKWKTSQNYRNVKEGIALIQNWIIPDQYQETDSQQQEITRETFTEHQILIFNGVEKVGK